jgi:DNA modification methylase
MPQLDFTTDNSLYATHGLHSYAAKCPPQLVRYGLRYYSKPGDRVLDPMAGSGTTLVEARLMGRNAIGYDIDPLARLIAQVKCRHIHDLAISNSYDVIERRVTRDLKALHTNRVSQALRDRATPPDFPNRDYWFSGEVSEVLAILSSHIKATHMDEAVRNFFFVAFSSLILARTSVANARDIIHSRHHFWQHPEPPDVMTRFGMRVKRMRAQMAEFLNRSRNVPATRVEARVGDARCLKLQEETFDLVFSSPPYATALDYPRAHFLAVPWLSSSIGVNFKEYWVNAPRYIGSERGRLSADLELDARIEDLAITSSVIQRLSKHSQPHANLIQRYFVDMYQVLRKIHSVLKVNRHAIIVVCPSHIRKVIVPTHQVLVEIGELHGLTLKNSYTRRINKRRRLLPYLKEAFGKRMDLEYVLILQKTN